MSEVDWVRVWTSSVGTGCLAAVATFPAIRTATTPLSRVVAVLTSVLTGVAVTLKSASNYLANPNKIPDALDPPTAKSIADEVARVMPLPGG